MEPFPCSFLFSSPKMQPQIHQFHVHEKCVPYAHSYGQFMIQILQANQSQSSCIPFESELIPRGKIPKKYIQIYNTEFIWGYKAIKGKSPSQVPGATICMYPWLLSTGQGQIQGWSLLGNMLKIIINFSLSIVYMITNNTKYS